MSQVGKSVADVFNLRIDDASMHRFKSALAANYRVTYQEILDGIVAGPVFHVDETSVTVRKGGKGYVWVFAATDKAYYVYKDSREAAFLHDLFRGSSGVLVSDFFTGYDSLACPQQKCMVHLMRDINEDLLRNPFNEELKELAKEFGRLLGVLIESIDRYGLKRRHLQKHRKAARSFLEAVSSRSFSTEIGESYQKRFRRSGEKLFTFLDYDGVPWNNNCAEHAVKAFARYRRYTDGRFTETSIADYLILLTVFQTCELSGVNVLRFLLSQETGLQSIVRFR